VLRYISRRVLLSILVVFVVASVTFFGLRLTGDPAAIAQLRAVGAPASEIAQTRHALGYDRPIPLQYLTFIKQTAEGDLGTSSSFQQRNLGLILGRLPYTLELTAAAMLLVLVLAIPLGAIAAARHGRATDRSIQTGAALGQAVPNFVIGPLLILVFAVHWQWFPVSGTGGIRALVLPALTLAIYPLSQIVRLLRNSMLEEWRSDHVATARAKGLPEHRVVTKHILRNALLPVLTLLGLQIAALMGGAVVVESIFAWPGIGRFSVQALLFGDFALAQAIVIVMTIIVVAVNLLTDIAYVYADPRIRLR
jgi:peptide/nickel transport system permease protein